MEKLNYQMFMPLNIQMFAENKVQYGIENVHYAVATEEPDGTLKYGSPVPFRGATAINLDPQGGQNPFYADNRVYYTTTTNDGYSGTLTMAMLTERFRMEVLGDTMEGGVLTENSNAKSKVIALLFEFDGDQKATRHVLYNVSVSRPGLAGATKTDSTEPGTQEIAFTAAPRIDGVVKRSTVGNTNPSVYNSWYTEVFEPEADQTPLTVTVVPTDEDTDVSTTTKIVWMFNKAIKETDMTSANFFVMNSVNGEVAGALSLSTDKTTVTFAPTAPLVAATSYVAIATKNIKDDGGNSLAINSVTNFTTEV